MIESLGTASNEHSYSFQVMEPFWRSERKGGSFRIALTPAKNKRSCRTEGWRCKNSLPANVALETGLEHCDSENRHVSSVCKLATYNVNDHQERKHMEFSVKCDIISKTLCLLGNNHSWWALDHILWSKI